MRVVGRFPIIGEMAKSVGLSSILVLGARRSSISCCGIS
jgi:hypothetical protein